MLFNGEEIGKTTLGAAIGSWYFECGPPHSEIYCLANDKEQARSRIYDDIVYDQEEKGQRAQKWVIPGDNGTFIQVLASEHRSAAGGRQALTLWDELHGYYTERSKQLWTEMTPPPTVKSPLRVIVTYAGYEDQSELLWKLYEENWLNAEPVPELIDIVNSEGEPVCRARGKTFVHWDDTPRFPWQTDEFYEEQYNTLPSANEFLRLHRNQWITTKEEFIPIKYWDKAAKKLDGPIHYQPNHEFRNLPVSVGVDAAWKNDCVAVVGTFFDHESGNVGIAFHKIWNPKDIPEGEMFDLEMIGEYIEEMSKQHAISAIVYDPTQLHQTMTNLHKKGFIVVDFPQTTTNMISATQHLYDLMINFKLMAYENDECRNHVKFSSAENKGRGARLVKPEKRSKNPIDFTVALAMSAFDATRRGGVDTSVVTVIESPFGDVSDIEHKTTLEREAEKVLPPELR